MIVTIDTNTLIHWTCESDDSDEKLRLDLLFEKVKQHAGGRIVVPAPVFAEFLIKTDEATKGWFTGLERKRSVVVAPLDKRAAFECALIDKSVIATYGNKKGQQTEEPWQKIKVDRQVLAIAKANNSDLLVSNDKNMHKSAELIGVNVMYLQDLELPESAKQKKLDWSQDLPPIITKRPPSPVDVMPPQDLNNQLPPTV